MGQYFWRGGGASVVVGWGGGPSGDGYPVQYKRMFFLPFADRMPGVLRGGQTLFSECNSNCSCSADVWDPVCSDSGITYISPCLAGCLSYSGYGKKTVGPPPHCLLAVDRKHNVAQRCIPETNSKQPQIRKIRTSSYRCSTTALACPLHSRRAAVHPSNWGSAPKPKAAAAVSPPTWPCPFSAPLSAPWESRLLTWSL